MPPGRTVFERTYDQLKRQIVRGPIPYGSTLNLQCLADEFGVSVSPLRDAVHRLVGEHFLMLKSQGGFYLPVPTARCILQLYAWHELLVRPAARTKPPRTHTSTIGLGPATGEDMAQATTKVFTDLVLPFANDERLWALQNVSERLFRVRLAEFRAIRDMLSELDRLRAVAATGSISDIRTALAAYHRRRKRRAIQISVMILSDEIAKI
jgi:hypothetical protein